MHKHLLVFALSWVQRGQISIDQGFCSFSCSYKEVVVDLLNGSFSLSSLRNHLFRESMNHLEFFIPVPDVRFKPKQRVDDSSLIFLRPGLILFFLIECCPMEHWCHWVSKEVWFSTKQLVNVLLQILSERW